MIKYAENHGWDFGIRQLSMIVRNTKEASVKDVSEALEFASALKPSSTHTPIVVIAMGSTDCYGPNRNADGFSAEMLKKYHKTFEQFGKVFANHKNKNPKENYGEILKSFFNEDMDRVELVLHLDNDKASKYIERVDQGKSLPVSMGIHIPHDICNICHHYAPTTKNWCKHMKRGGDFGGNTIYYVDEDPLEEHPDKDGHQIFVHNPSGKFFDISMVTKNADKTAFMIYGPKKILGQTKEASEFNSGFIYDTNGMKINNNPPPGATNNYHITGGAYGNQGDGLHTSQKEVLHSEKTSKDNKRADMIKKIDGMGVGLKKYKDEHEKHISEKAAYFLARCGITNLPYTIDVFNKHASEKLAFCDIFNVVHLCLTEKFAAEIHLKQAAANQLNFVEAVEENPSMIPAIKSIFSKTAEYRGLTHQDIKAIKNVEGFSRVPAVSQYAQCAPKIASDIGLISAYLYLESAPSMESITRGRSIAYNTKTASINNKFEASLFDSADKIFNYVSRRIQPFVFS